MSAHDDAARARFCPSTRACREDASHIGTTAAISGAAWAAFARSGNPDHSDMPHWPAFDPGTFPTLVFANEVRVSNDPNRDERLALGGIG